MEGSITHFSVQPAGNQEEEVEGDADEEEEAAAMHWAVPSLPEIQTKKKKQRRLPGATKMQRDKSSNASGAEK